MHIKLTYFNVVFFHLKKWLITLRYIFSIIKRPVLSPCLGETLSSKSNPLVIKRIRFKQRFLKAIFCGVRSTGQALRLLTLVVAFYSYVACERVAPLLRKRFLRFNNGNDPSASFYSDRMFEVLQEFLYSCYSGNQIEPQNRWRMWFPR